MTTEFKGIGKTTLFTDSEGREWDCKLNLAKAQLIDNSDYSLVSDMIGRVSFLKPSQELFQELLTNDALAFAVIWTIVRDQAKQHGFPEDEDDCQYEFMSGVDGDNIETIKESFWKAVSDFFPKFKTALLPLISSVRHGEERARKKLAEMETEMRTMIEEDIDQEMMKFQEELSRRRRGRKLGESLVSSDGPQEAGSK